MLAEDCHKDIVDNIFCSQDNNDIFINSISTVFQIKAMHSPIKSCSMKLVYAFW